MISSDCYNWLIDSGDGEEGSNTNNSVEYDRRNAVFDAILENNGYGVVR